VNPIRIAKSIGVERTFEHDEQHQTHLLTPLETLSKELEQRQEIKVLMLRLAHWK